METAKQLVEIAAAAGIKLTKAAAYREIARKRERGEVMQTNPNPNKKKTSVTIVQSITFFMATDMILFGRTQPTSNAKNPACMINTKTAEMRIQRKSNEVFRGTGSSELVNAKTSDEYKVREVANKAPINIGIPIFFFDFLWSQN